MVRVRVPATTANLGSGYDCLGLALQLYNSVTLEPSEHLDIEVFGQGERELPRNEANLAYRAALAVYEALGAKAPALHLRLVNEVPLRRGLGSSASAVVGGLVAANALNGFPLSDQELLGLACRLEGHPDNVCAAFCGGLVVSSWADGRVEYVRVPIAAGLRGVAFIPDFQMPTDRARSLLPSTVSLGDAVFNIGRSSLLVAAMSTGRFDLLGVATEDRLHQRYRRELFPSMDDFIGEARRAGAHGAFLSGAGSTILALTSGAEREVSEAMSRVAERRGIGGQVVIVELCDRGVEVSD